MKIDTSILKNKYLILKNLKGDYISVFVVKNKFKLQDELKDTVKNYFKNEEYEVKYHNTHIIFSKDEDFLYIYNANGAIINV